MGWDDIGVWGGGRGGEGSTVTSKDHEAVGGA